MYEEFNPTQKMMLEAIDKELERAHEALNKANNDADKKKLRERIAMLKEQKENAKKPVKRTPEEIAAINKIADNIKKNSEGDGAQVKGVRADKKLTRVEEFEFKLKNYVNEMHNRTVEMEKALAVYKEIIGVLESHSPASEEGFYKHFIEDLKKRVGSIEEGKLSMQEKLKTSDESIKLLIENFPIIEKMNQFLNNPLGLSE